MNEISGGQRYTGEEAGVVEAEEWRGESAAFSIACIHCPPVQGLCLHSRGRRWSTACVDGRDALALWWYVGPVDCAGARPIELAAYRPHMFFSFLRPGRGREDSTARQRSPFAGSPETSRNRVVGQRVDDEDLLDEEEEIQRFPSNRIERRATSYFDAVDEEEYDEEEDGDGGEDEDDVNTPLLPIFSAALLDKLPLYNITHAIRLLIVQKCETTLSWDQLRSPQISQFLVKPVQNQIRTNHFNRATLCALIANCLQFQKEGQQMPGNVGVSKTRALISELLAMRLIKEYTTRELIDALSYDFDPLQGRSPPPTAAGGNQGRLPGFATPALHSDISAHRAQNKAARVSTIEISIRAQAKRFLAHPLVVQHLESIWAGNIVFHSEADNLHRKPSSGEEPFNRHRGSRYGTIEEHSPTALPADSVLSRKARETRTNKRPSLEAPSARRSVTLYNPRDASLFKLSRLRVPRYRQVLSTASFAVMLALFVTVLMERSVHITPLEVVFWLWSAGYMLDEVVGFTEQGFGLYILSFWNAFDLGILLLFVMYYCLRLYGLALADENKKHIAYMAYDVLAATAILLFPRLFSILDHYRYFSQLLIAFRMMAQDLLAILALIVISCSGFFVAFTLSFADEDTDGSGVAYELFQILMGFTPAAWEKWSGYNMLGKAIMTVFLIICHFLIVTILITVLTNSFMAIVQNANEEHQFLFAVNTISMVKSDALFSYIAPTNVFGWVMSPLRYVMPFRQYVKLNRTIIKVTHFPILFVIFSYERMFVSRSAFTAEDLVERQHTHKKQPMAFSINKAPDVFSPRGRLREPSVISFHKDRALDEVFRRPYRGSTVRTTTRDMEPDRRNSDNAVDRWMQGAENEGGASPPVEQPMSVVERLETRRPQMRRAATADKARFGSMRRDFSTATRSLGSEPDVLSSAAPRRPRRIVEEDEDLLLSNETLPQETDADGDDENNGESDHADPAIGESAISIIDKENRSPGSDSETGEYFTTPKNFTSPMMQLSSAAQSRLADSPDILGGRGTPYQARPHARREAHDRQVSSGTIMFAPQQTAYESSSTQPPKPIRPLTAKNTNSGTATPSRNKPPTGTRTPTANPLRTRPIMPPRQKTAPGLTTTGVGMSFLDVAGPRRQPSFNARALDLASEIGDNKIVNTGNIFTGGISGMPNSFSEQMLRERELQRERDEEERGTVNRLLLSRMHTLEQNFREILKEVKDISRSNANSSRRDSESELLHPTAIHSRRQSKGNVESLWGSGGGSGQTTATAPQTPSRQLSTREGKGKKSPRKHHQRRKTADMLQHGLGPLTQAAQSRARAEKEEDDVSPQSVQSVVEIPKSEEGQSSTGATAGTGARDEGEDERPATAVRTPEPGTRSA